ncbi:MAG: ABC transporter ATP-binding protein/permease [Sphingomonadaceae bacterium]|nr:ABC transporter ATP-binding protein/permease [Sphingomonadaceae bacterium]
MRLPAMLSIPLSSSHYRSIAILLTLMLLSAVTEGLGLILLVPMLGVLGGEEASGNRVAELFASTGIPLSLSWLLGAFVLLVLLRAVVNYARMIASFRFEISVVDSLRARAWSALLHCDWRHLSSMRQSDNTSLLITNIDRVGSGLQQGLHGLAMLITLAGVGVAAFAISPQLAIAALAIGAAVLIAYRGIRRKAAVLGEQLTSAYAHVYARLTEGLDALRVIKSFGREAREAQDGISAFTGLRRTQLAYLRSSGFAQIALHVGGALLLAVLVWIAIGKWHAGTAEIIPLVALFARSLPLLQSLQRSWQDWAHSAPAAESTMRLIAQTEQAQEDQPPPGLAAPQLTEALVLKDLSVHFESRDRPALKGLSLAFPAGSITAISGPSGAGKSTLADLVGGLIAPDSGTVSVDGIALDGGLRRAWRERVTYVQQEPILFSGTIRENFLWADPGAGDEQIESALQAASAGFVHELPMGLETLIGESGRQLSGGEKQRLVLARALLRNPTLLILDEVSSALDSENEAVITDAVSQLRGVMTIVIIGHRGSLGDLADRTVRLEAGHVVSSTG